MSNALSAVVDRIIANPKGGTVHLGGLPLPTTGYFVGGAGAALAFRGRREIDRYLTIQLLLRADACYIGWWTDPGTGKVWVDQSEWYPFLADARREAAYRGEIAFWDIARGEEVRVS